MDPTPHMSSPLKVVRVQCSIGSRRPRLQHRRLALVAFAAHTVPIRVSACHRHPKLKLFDKEAEKTAIELRR
jgi:hypothetical protein